MRKKKVISFLVPLAASLFALLTIGCFFLPSVQAITSQGETILLPGYLVLFGGEYVVELPSGLYAFSFRVNLALLALTQALLLSAVSCFLGRSSPFNRYFSLGFFFVATICLFFYREWLCLFSPIPKDGLEFAYGHYLMIIFALIALGLSLFQVVLSFFTIRRT